MNLHENNNKNIESSRLTPQQDIKIFDYAKAFNLLKENTLPEDIINKALLAQEHTSQIIQADRNDLSHTGSCLQKEKNILTAINGINPNDATESMLASQMITTHNSAMCLATTIITVRRQL